MCVYLGTCRHTKVCGSLAPVTWGGHAKLGDYSLKSSLSSWFQRPCSADIFWTFNLSTHTVHTLFSGEQLAFIAILSKFEFFVMLVQSANLSIAAEVRARVGARVPTCIRASGNRLHAGQVPIWVLQHTFRRTWDIPFVSTLTQRVVWITPSNTNAIMLCLHLLMMAGGCAEPAESAVWFHHFISSLQLLVSTCKSRSKIDCPGGMMSAF